MNSTVFALVGIGGLAVVYAAYSKSKTTAQAAVQTKGVVDPNYNSKALIFAADQKSRMSGASGASKIADNPCSPSEEILVSCGYPRDFVGPITETQACSQPSGITFPIKL